MRCSELYREAIGMGFHATFIAEFLGEPTPTVELPRAALPSRSEQESVHLANLALAKTSYSTVILTDLPERRIARAASQIVKRCHGSVIVNATCETFSESPLAVVRGVSRCANGEPPMIGWGFEVVRSEVRALRPSVAPLRMSINHVMVTFGAADPGMLTERFLSQWKRNSDLRVMLVLGSAFSNDRISSLTRFRSDTLEVVHAPSNFPRLLRQIDGVVLQGGQTLVESMCIGTPVFAVRWGHLANDITRAEEEDLVTGLGEPHSMFDSLTTVVARTSDVNRRTQSAFGAVDGLGAQRTLHTVAEAFT